MQKRSLFVCPVFIADTKKVFIRPQRVSRAPLFIDCDEDDLTFVTKTWVISKK